LAGALIAAFSERTWGFIGPILRFFINQNHRANSLAGQMTPNREQIRNHEYCPLPDVAAKWTAACGELASGWSILTTRAARSWDRSIGIRDSVQSCHA